MIIKDVKSGGKKALKQITIIDENYETIEICLWGEFAYSINLGANKAYLIKNIKIKKFSNQTYLIWENYTKIHNELDTYYWSSDKMA